MSYTVWHYCEENHIMIQGIVLSDIPTRRLAERLVASLEDVYDDNTAWVEED